ncbi:flagellar basal-body rod protein FlgG [Parvibaculum sedimenti]|uniref:Flagellar basal-body rod protein FlgG n=1 Tax=Parvibaculum sedimenti TaxID=2608632 RepID=A0A6N6VKM5_9HYPH|nr:flagellar basal-body rod protein FlgG [Parvibaculum sedimenti]KAB7739098.1 flagellar basal-body rod protein FlgG [Parvibaculum sedimenti]
MQALSIAATGMMAQQLNVEVISNNIANMSTTGFKKQRAEFQDLLYQNLRRVGTNSSDTGTVVPSGVQIGLGVKTGSVYRIMNQGDMDNTGNKLDMAIQGRGYFRVQLPSGEDAYTRAGNFSLSATGQIVTSDGYTVQPGITIPSDATDITISKDGQVQATIPGQTAAQVVGQLDLATFPNDAGLDPQGDNLFLETAASGAPSVATPGTTGVGTLLQGFLETSNVNAVTEISSLITAQRAYEMNSKVITAADEMMSVTSNLK